MNESCIFDRIISGEIPAEIIYQSDHYMAFLDRFPIVEGHTLLITKRHIETVYEMNKSEQQSLGGDITNVIKMLEQIYGSNINIVNTSGKEASQAIYHVHFHLIPRSYKDRLWDEDRSRIVLDTSSRFERLKPTLEELFEIGEKIRQAQY